MNKIRLFLAAMFVSLAGFSYAQAEAGADSVVLDKGKLNEYKRSSLTSFMVYHPEDTFANEIYNAYISNPFPDKFNNHNISATYMSFAEVMDDQGNGLYKEEYGNILKKEEIEYNGKVLESYLNRMKIPMLMVAKWFNLHGNDSTGYAFDMSLVHERGFYDATLLDVEKAMQTVRGTRILADAGEELIGNTYVLVNDMTYITAEERARMAVAVGGLVDEILKIFGFELGLEKIIEKYAKMFSGFTVKNHSYLLRLVWNDSIASKFYNDYYTETWDSTKIVSFLADTTTFRLEYVAHELEFGAKTTLKGKYEREYLAKMLTARSIDKNIAALQKQYEDFKVKTPITEVLYNDKGKIIGYAAQIGTKEGIDKKSKFEVVRESFNPETGQTEYKRVATLKVKGDVWNNEYMATELAAEDQGEGTDLKYTVLKKTSGGDVYPGMLIIEGKYKKAKD